MQTFLVGICYFGNIYMVPLYLQNVLGASAIKSAALLLPLVLTQTFTTTLSGYVLKWTNRTKTSFCVGFVLWCAGQAGQVAFSRTTTVGVIVGVLLVQGLGIGATLQSSASLSYSHHSLAEGRADEDVRSQLSCSSRCRAPRRTVRSSPALASASPLSPHSLSYSLIALD